MADIARRARGPGRALRAGRGPLARLREDPGRLPAPLRLLHRAGRARAEPEPGARRSCVDQVRRPRRAPATSRSRSPAWTSATTAGISTRARRWPPCSGQLAEVHGLRWLRLSSVLPVLLHAGADRRGDDAAGDRAASAPAAAERQRPRAAPDAAAVPHRACTGRSWSGWPRPFPGSGLGADVIVGHPGETDGGLRGDDALRRGAAVLVPPRLRLLGPQGDRGGAPAGPRAGARRSASGAAGCAGCGAREEPAPSAAALVGRRRDVLVLDDARSRAPGLLAGLTDNYVEVLFAGPDALGRRIVPLTITEARADRTHGQLEEIGA